MRGALTLSYFPVNVGDTAIVSPCADFTNCCGTAENVTACCANGNGFTWVNATFVSEVQTPAAGSVLSAVTTVVTATTTTTTTAFAANSAVATATSTSKSNSTEPSCTSQNNSPGAGVLGTLLGLVVMASLVLAVLLSRSKRAASHKPRGQVYAVETTEANRAWSKKEQPATPMAKEWPGLVQVYELG
jgi:hypothetical protein